MRAETGNSEKYIDAGLIKRRVHKNERKTRRYHVCTFWLFCFSLFSVKCYRWLAGLCNIVDQLFGIIPSETRVCDGLAIDMITDLLASGL